MKKKLMIILPVLLVIGFVAYSKLKPAEPMPKHKIEGEVYVLPKEFLVNLRAGRFAKLGVALVLEPEAGGGHGGGEGEGGSAAALPEGYGPLPQEPVVRSIITDVLTDQPASRLSSAPARKRLQRRIRERLEESTDVHATDVMFTDVAVQ
ncbi:MAG: flagellar basal body-associated FliL family protein [Solirubrobacterales bacterium]|nr:flagellar basal body-associated FliL family protein [Solirubrobacterales bacterium]